MSLTYNYAINQLLGLADFERKSRAGEPPDFHLRRMELLLALANNPHQGIPTVHIAGSKGKGSTAAMIASALGAAGLSVGLYTSPHLHAFNERIRIGMQPIEKPIFAALIQELWPLVLEIAQLGSYGTVSVFELLTAMAFVHFQRSQVAVQVIEVGLGGRLDATNVVSAQVAVLTPISMDHVHVLGNTLGKIASEKAGIIKPGAIAVTAPQTNEAMSVFQKVARNAGAELRESACEVSLDAEPTTNMSGHVARFVGRSGQYRACIPMLGAHQIENARTAVAALETLGELGHPVSSNSIETGLNRVQWPARSELLKYRGQRVLIDGAHNEASGRALAATLKRHFPDTNSYVLILGASSGHVFADTVTALALLNPRVVVTRTRHPKALQPSQLITDLTSHNITVIGCAADCTEALALAVSAAGAEDLIVATGSLFVAAEIRELILNIAPEIYPET